MEENVLMGGFGSALMELLADEGIFGYRIERLGVQDVFVEHATQTELRRKYGIDEEGIREAVRKMISR